MLLAHARNPVTLTFGILLAASLTVSPAHAGARASNSASTVAAAGLAVAGGTVTSASGAAMPGVAVDLYAWPSDAVLKEMKPGVLVPTTLLATATTSSAGRYMLKVPAAKLKAAAVESGYANLEIFSAVGGIWFLPYQTGSLPARPSAPVTVNLGSRKGLLCGTDPEGQAYGFTGFTLERARNPAWAVVGQGYIVKSKRTAGDFVQFEYDETISHTQASALGVGLSGYGFDAGYNGSGSNESTATASEGYPNQAKSTWFRTMFSVGQYRGECIGPQSDSGIPFQKQHGRCPRKFTNDLGMVFYVHKCFWIVKSTGWFSGASQEHPKPVPNTPAKFCAFQARDTKFKTSNETAIQWSGGFELGAGIGVKGVNLKASFSASAQTGYDANALMQFDFKHAGFICGTNKSPPRAAIVVMRGSKS